MGKIANDLNDLQLPRFRVTKRAVRERYSLLSEKFKAKMRQEDKASGIETDVKGKLGQALAVIHLI